MDAPQPPSPLIPVDPEPPAPPDPDEPGRRRRDSKPGLFQVGRVRLEGKGMRFALALALIVVVALMALLKWVIGVALGILQLLLVILGGAAILTSAVFLVATLLGVVRWIGVQREVHQGEMQNLGGCPFPRAAVIRGEEPPRSQVEATMATLIWHELEQDRVDPQSLSDFQAVALLLQLAKRVRDPVYRAILERHIVQPCFGLLADGNPFVLAQIERYGQLRKRVPFWELQRLVHLLSGGRVGLSAEAAWENQDIAALQADYRTFCAWFMRYGLALLSRLESFIDDVFVPVPSGHKPNLEQTSTTSPTEQDRARSAQLTKLVGEDLNVTKPWLNPREQLEQFANDLDEAKFLDPENLSAARLLARVEEMQRRVEDFEADYAQALSTPDEHWPSWYDEAWVASAKSNELTDEVVKGHAARLYLTRIAEEVFEVSDRDASATKDAEPSSSRHQPSCTCSGRDPDPDPDPEPNPEPDPDPDDADNVRRIF